MKIFILEDDPVRVNAFVQAGIGQELTIAQDFEGAVKKFTPPYDLILLDHDLGGHQFVQNDGREKTGFDFVLWLVAENHRPVAPVVIHSYNPDGAASMKAVLAHHTWDVVRIPFGPAVLNLVRKEE